MLRVWFAIILLWLLACEPGAPVLRAEDAAPKREAMVQTQIAARGVRDAKVLGHGPPEHDPVGLVHRVRQRVGCVDPTEPDTGRHAAEELRAHADPSAAPPASRGGRVRG